MSRISKENFKKWWERSGMSARAPHVSQLIPERETRGWLACIVRSCRNKPMEFYLLLSHSVSRTTPQVSSWVWGSTSGRAQVKTEVPKPSLSTQSSEDSLVYGATGARGAPRGLGRLSWCPLFKGRSSTKALPALPPAAQAASPALCDK